MGKRQEGEKRYSVGGGKDLEGGGINTERGRHSEAQL